MIGQIRARKRS